MKKTRLSLYAVENPNGIFIADPPAIWDQISIVLEDRLAEYARHEYVRGQLGWFVGGGEVDPLADDLRACLCEAGFEVDLTLKAVDADEIKPAVRLTVVEGGDFADLTIDSIFVPPRGRVSRLLRAFATSFGATRDDCGCWFIPSPTLFGFADTSVIELIDALSAEGVVVLQDTVWNEQKQGDDTVELA